MSLIIDLDLVCLVCLQEEASMRSVFDKDGSNGLTLGDKITKCSNFRIEKEMKLPDKICDNCIADLNIAFRFHQNCETANLIFESITKSECIVEDQEDNLNNKINAPEKTIKVPSGWKINRIKSVRNAVAMKKEISAAVLSSSFSQAEMENEEKKEVEKHYLDEEENFMTADYFENADTLEEDEYLSTCDENNSEDIKLLSAVKVECDDQKEEKINDSDNKETENTVPDQTTKRGRGRPRKSEISMQSKRLESCDKSDRKLKTIRNSSPRQAKSLSPMRYYSPRKMAKSLDVKPAKICDICGNSYKYQHALNSHMRRHRNERPFNCEFCDKAFVSAVELRRHMRVHTGQKPYACQYCERRFSDFGSRIKHERTHTGERPYACGTCGKAFAYAHVLSVHLRTHTGEKKFRCEECGKGFTKKAYLESHKNHHHSRSMTDDMIVFKQLGMEENITTTDRTSDYDDEAMMDVKIKLDPATVKESDDEIQFQSVEVP